MKPFCNIATNDCRQKMTMKINVGMGGIFSRESLFRLAPTTECWDASAAKSPCGDQRFRNPSPWMQAKVQPPIKPQSSRI
jgi:hypothetical protein